MCEDRHRLKEAEKEIEALQDEVFRLREAFGLSNFIDYERFKAGLPSLGPISKEPPKAAFPIEEILDHIRLTMPL